jgi:erythrocyte band 7 integral membrane protein
VDPGLYKINPFCEKILSVDIRMRVKDIPRQIALTKDNVSVNIDSVLYWDILDPYVATFLVSNVQKALIDRTQTTLRMVLGTKTLQESIEHRDLVAQEVRNIIDSVAASWGVRVESILLKDIILGPEILANLSGMIRVVLS